MEVDRAIEIEADVLGAVTGLAWIEGVYALDPSPQAVRDPDHSTLAIVRSPFGIQELVKSHSAILRATGTYETSARILYVDGRPIRQPRCSAQGGSRCRRATSRRDGRASRHTLLILTSSSARSSSETSLARVSTA